MRSYITASQLTFNYGLKIEQIDSSFPVDSRAAEGDAGQVEYMQSIRQCVIYGPHDNLYPDSAIIITITHVRGHASA